MPDNVVFCTSCGRRIWVPGDDTDTSPAIALEKTTAAVNVSSDRASTTSIQTSPKDHLIAASAYVTFIPAMIFLSLEPFKRNRFIRFHSLQSIFLAAGAIVVALAMRLLYSLLALIPVAGYLLAWLTVFVVFLGLLILWLVLLVKALQGEMFKLPVIGKLAEKL
jgi:uncharacterized membrane protein